jgi:uncharacterized membrane protein
MPSEDPRLPPHIEETIAAIYEVHAQHRRSTPPLQKAVAAVTATLARPACVAVLTLIVAGWIGLNLGLLKTGHRAPDPPPFTYLSEVVSLAALYLAATILIAQSHDEELATQRDQLTLQLALLNEQKSAKIIALLEEFRQRDPDHAGRRDFEAAAMAIPTDPNAVLAKIRSINEAADATSAHT